MNIKNYTVQALILLVIVVLSSCTIKNKLSRRYEGKSEQFLIEKMGKPTMIYQEGKGKTDVYEKKTRLRKTQINTGSYQYDRFESPESIKIEIYRFFINPSGIVKDVKYDYRYER
jgi:hypothetical protein